MKLHEEFFVLLVIAHIQETFNTKIVFIICIVDVILIKNVCLSKIASTWSYLFSVSPILTNKLVAQSASSCQRSKTLHTSISSRETIASFDKGDNRLLGQLYRILDTHQIYSVSQIPIAFNFALRKGPNLSLLASSYG